jgi:glycosyltransferase involved in cell wall biosynthesis
MEKNRDINLVLVSYLDFPYYEGSSKRIEGIIRVLESNGMHVFVICPLLRRIHPSPEYRGIVDYVDLRTLKPLHRSKLGKFILNSVFSVLALNKLIRLSIKKNTVFQYQDLYSSIPVVILKLVTQKKIIGDDIVPLFFDEGRLHPSLARFFQFLDLTILKFTDLIITASPKAYSFIKTSSLKNKCTLFFPNGVIGSDERILTIAKKDQQKIIVFVGTLSFDQNIRAITSMLEVIRTLKKKTDDFRMLVVGGPLHYASHLFNDNLVRDGTIRFLGYVSDEKLADIYDQAFIGLLPFFKETPLCGGQRTKALEYFSHGLLVVSGPEGLKGIMNLKVGEHCLMADSTSEMTRILNECLSNPKKYEFMRSNGQRFIDSVYTWDALSKNYLQIIPNLLENNKWVNVK